MRHSASLPRRRLCSLSGHIGPGTGLGASVNSSTFHAESSLDRDPVHIAQQLSAFILGEDTVAVVRPIKNCTKQDKCKVCTPCGAGRSWRGRVSCWAPRSHTLRILWRTTALPSVAESQHRPARRTCRPRTRLHRQEHLNHPRHTRAGGSWGSTSRIAARCTILVSQNMTWHV